MPRPDFPTGALMLVVLLTALATAFAHRGSREPAEAAAAELPPSP
jgi:hypothetical protein